MMKKSKLYRKLFFIVLLAGFLLRFSGLGYSDFYGDETKTFYLDKTIPATQFLLDQRKGPVQFVVVWAVEKITGGWAESTLRIPFALAGFLSIIALFKLTKELFDERVALITSALFSLNGFYIAFSRTVQYQSFLVLFGLLSVYYALVYYKFDPKKPNKLGFGKPHYLMLSGLFLALAYLSHYDAVFFDIAVGYILIKKLLEDKTAWREILNHLVLPFLFLVGIFYVPYLIKGYLGSNTLNYLNKRVSGLEYAKNVSWYTFWIYNPSLIWPALSLVFLPLFFAKSTWKKSFLTMWFFLGFIAFQFIFTNPGTHIHNYFIPLFILLAYLLADYTKKHILLEVGLGAIFLILFFINVSVYLPRAHSGYPWKQSNVLFKNAEAIDKRFHLFLYGFPYNRGWNQIADYINERGGVHKVYTNDNGTIAEYYLRGIAYTPPGSNYLPEFYIEVEDNQEFRTTEMIFTPNQFFRYELEKEFFVEDVEVARLYVLKD